jgi:hypothetical protein
MLPPLAAALLLGGYALYTAAGPFEPPDFFIYRLGAELAARGESPYDLPTLRRHVAERFPNPPGGRDNLVDNCGYFLPPMAVFVFAPFAALPWAAAKTAWAVLVGVSAYFVARLPTALPAPGAPPGVAASLVAPFLLVVNPLVLAVVVTGQFTLVFVGCVAAGLLAFGRGRPYLAAALWVLPFAKPHLALPLIPLAWYLGGWRPAALLVALVGTLNVLGAVYIGGSPLFLGDYFAHLSQARDAVRYNRVELNGAITSWNRLLYSAGGPAVELGLAGTVASYSVWFGLAAARGGRRPSPAWAAAAAAVGAVLCAQVIVYEALFLAVAVPWIRDVFARGHPVRGLLAVGLLAVHLIPQARAEAVGVGSHHALAVALLAVLILLGPVGPRPRPEPREGRP